MNKKVQKVRNLNYTLLSICLLGVGFTASSQDLTVEEGTNYVVPADASQTFDNVVVLGTIQLRDRARLIVNGDFSIEAGAEATLQSYAGLTVNGQVKIESGSLVSMMASLSIMKAEGLVISDATLNLGAHSEVFVQESVTVQNDALVTMDGVSRFTVGEDFSLTSGASLLVRESSVVALQGNFTAVDNASTSFHEGELKLTGAGSQHISAADNHLWNLAITGPGNKMVEVSNALTIANTLSLGSARLILNNPLKILSKDPGAINRTTGYVVTTSITRTLGNVGQGYMFPLGTSSQLRLVQLIPRASVSSDVVVELHVGSANNLSSQDQMITNINSGFYHKIYSQGNTLSTDVNIFLPNSETTYNRILSWNSQAFVWYPLPGFPGSSSAAPNLVGIGARNLEIQGDDGNNPGSSIFVLGTIQIPTPTSTETFAVLKKKIDGGYVLVKGGVLRFMFEEEYPQIEDRLNYRLYDNYREEFNIIEPLPVDWGHNKYELDMSLFPVNRVGYLEVTNNKGEKWFLKFKS